MDLDLSDDIEESFRAFQGRIIDEYETVDEFGLVAIDATRSIEKEQAEVRRIVSDALAGTKKTRIRRWVDLASLARARGIDLDELKGKLIVLEGTDGVGRFIHRSLVTGTSWARGPVAPE